MEMEETKESIKGAVIWFTGIPNAGKTILSSMVADELRQRGIKAALLDGNVVRETLSKGLGLSREDHYFGSLRGATQCRLGV